MAKHTHWRDCQAWMSEGLPLSTTSNEAAKLYDASLTQMISSTTDESVGGMEGSLKKMLEADPEFLLGYVLCNNLRALGTKQPLERDPEYRAAVDRMNELLENQDVTQREKLHVQATNAFARCDVPGAIDLWEKILISHPTDILAIRMVHIVHIITGFYPQLRDSLARIMPAWKPTIPLHEYLYGMYAFGLEETNFYDRAEKMALKGLSINENEGWAVHAVAHCMEMTGRYDDGIKFMTSREHDWAKADHLKAHNYWHTALMYIEKGDFDAALGIYDSHVLEGVKSKEMFPFTDGTSLLYRLEMQGVNVGDRWEDVYEIGRQHLDDHSWSFDDLHIIISCLKSQQKDTIVKTMMDSIDTFIRDGCGFHRDVMSEVGRPICQSFVAYEEGEFARAVDLLTPVRYQHSRIGGSAAQRDLIDQFLIHAAISSPDKEHNKLARHLIVERQAKKDDSPLNDRLMAKLVAAHTDI